jgi:Putative peptidoglycan binding domain/Tetratricopeptide repeat
MTTRTTETFAEIGIPTNPFPGLRPFDFNESHLFFGREGQSERLIEKLSRTRFLAVVGTSGSGKSSLVRAGLLPALHGGFMTSAGSNWRIAIMRPGNDPIGKLAAAINAHDVFGSEDEENKVLQIAITEATLRRGSRGLVDAVRQNAMPDKENLLIVVDQFEELFRFGREASRKTKEESDRYRNDAAAFVKLLVEAHSQREVNIYVVLTMRSDFLGDCSQFWDLPEAVNEGQYLIPRLTRDQLREAITAPIAVAGGAITPRLVNRLLNDIGDDQDQLPVLQHLLMRVWDEWKEKRLEVEIKEGGQSVRRPHKKVHEGAAIDLCCYEAVGGMAEALSRHADEAFNELPDDRHREVTEKLFKALTEKGPDNREIRRPITLGEICAVANATAAEVVTVIEAFRHPHKSFLMPPVGVALNSESLIDISHESLIRGWSRLKEWVDEEARSARIYRRLAETAVLYKESRAGLWRDPDLQLALSWRDRSNPNSAWAARYHSELGAAMSFLDESLAAYRRDEEERERQRRKEASYKRTRRIAVGFAFLSIVSLVSGVFAITLGFKANSALREFASQKTIADLARQEAERNLAAARVARENALRAEERFAALQRQRTLELERQRAQEQARSFAIKTKLAQQEASEAKESFQLMREARDKLEQGNEEGAINSYERLLKYYQDKRDQRGEYETRTTLAPAYLKQGQYAKARDYAEKALAIQRKDDRRGEHENVTVLRDAYQREGEYSKAEMFGERAIKIQEEIFGKDSTQLIPDLKSQVLVKESQKSGEDEDIPPSEPFRLRIAAIHNNSLREVASYLDELATYYRNEGVDEQEEKFLKQELRIQENIFGENDTELVGTLLNLVAVYRDQGEDRQADLLAERVKSIRGIVVGLRKGDRGDKVKNLQLNLGALGFTQGTAADGRFGPATEAALIAFQRSRGLVADGVAGEETLRALETETSAKTSIFRRVTVETVSKMFAGTPIDNIKTNLPLVLKALENQGLTDKDMILTSLAIIRAESGGFFAPLREGVSRFNTSPGGHPFDLYDNRKDVGNQEPGDGERFRGRGYVQLFGRANYQKYGSAIGLGNKLVEDPDLANQPDIAARLLVSFLKSKEEQIRSALLAGDLKTARRLVNGGSHGLAEFTQAFRTGQSLLQ